MKFLFRFCIFAIVGFSTLLMTACTPNVRHQDANQNNSGDLLTLLDPETTTEEQALSKAEEAIQEGKKEIALFYFAKALRFNKQNIYALEQIASIHGSNNKQDLVAKVCNEILALDSNNEFANEKLGLYALKKGQVDDAKRFLSKVVSRNDGNWESHNGLGIIADLEKDYTAAIRRYQAALKVHTNSPLLLNNLGYSYYLSGDLKKARNFFNQALRIDNQYKRAIHNLALIEIKQNAFANAFALFNRVMEPYEALNNIGYICMINKQYASAEEYLRRAISESPVYFPKAQENLKTLMALKKSDSEDESRSLPEKSLEPERQDLLPVAGEALKNKITESNETANTQPENLVGLKTIKKDVNVVNHQKTNQAEKKTEANGLKSDKTVANSANSSNSQKPEEKDNKASKKDSIQLRDSVIDNLASKATQKSEVKSSQSDSVKEIEIQKEATNKPVILNIEESSQSLEQKHDNRKLDSDTNEAEQTVIGTSDNEPQSDTPKEVVEKTQEDTEQSAKNTAIPLEVTNKTGNSDHESTAPIRPIGEQNNDQQAKLSEKKDSEQSSNSAVVQDATIVPNANLEQNGAMPEALSNNSSSPVTMETKPEAREGEQIEELKRDQQAAVTKKTASALSTINAVDHLSTSRPTVKAEKNEDILILPKRNSELPQVRIYKVNTLYKANALDHKQEKLPEQQETKADEMGSDQIRNKTDLDSQSDVFSPDMQEIGTDGIETGSEKSISKTVDVEKTIIPLPNQVIKSNMPEENEEMGSSHTKVKSGVINEKSISSENHEEDLSEDMVKKDTEIQKNTTDQLGNNIETK